MWLLVVLSAGLLALAWLAERRACKNWRPTLSELNRQLRARGLPEIRMYRFEPLLPPVFDDEPLVGEYPLTEVTLAPLVWEVQPPAVYYFPAGIRNVRIT